MSTSVLPWTFPVDSSRFGERLHAQEQVVNGDTLHRQLTTVPAVVVFLSAGDHERNAIVAELQERGCSVQALDLHAKNFPDPSGVVHELAATLRWRSKLGCSATALAISAPRRADHLDAQRLEFPRLTIDRRRYEVHVDQQLIEFSKTELDLLFILASFPEIVLSRRELVEACKGESYPATDRSIDVQIVGVRRKLGPVRDYLQTVRGAGYRFVPPKHDVRTASRPR